MSAYDYPDNKIKKCQVTNNKSLKIFTIGFAGAQSFFNGKEALNSDGEILDKLSQFLPAVASGAEAAAGLADAAGNAAGKLFAGGNGQSNTGAGGENALLAQVKQRQAQNAQDAAQTGSLTGDSGTDTLTGSAGNDKLQKATPPVPGRKPAFDATGRMIRDRKSDTFGPFLPDTQQRGTHTIDTFLPRIIGDEGTKQTSGKTSPNAVDPYGASKMGIANKTLVEYKDFKDKKGEKLPTNFTTDPKKVTSELARQVYDEYYYKRYNVDKIKDENIAGQVLDSSINPGPKQTATWLQEELNNHLDEKIKVDGTIGPQTRQAIEKIKEGGLLRDVNNALARRRIEYYKKTAAEHPTRSGFLSGWLKRAESYILPPVSKRKPLR